MTPPAWFFNRVATIAAVLHPQDAAGGEVPTPGSASVQVPCCLQQDAGPERSDGQGRRSSTAHLRAFFRPIDLVGRASLLALKADDRIVISGHPNPLLLQGPAFDASGRGAVWEATLRESR